MKRKPAHPPVPASVSGDRAEEVAIACLGHLAADPERLGVFLGASGLDVGDLRRAAGDPDFLAGVLDHLMGDEGALLACAQALEIAPEVIMGAALRLSPREFE